MRKNSYLLILLTYTTFTYAQISGIVLDSLTNKPLEYVNIILADTAIGLQTDSLGYFQLDSINKSGYSMIFERIGYRSKQKRFFFTDTSSTKLLYVRLNESPLISAEILVEKSKWVNPQAQHLTTHYILSEEDVYSSVGGFEDPLKSIQTLPGMISRNDFTSNYYIRGTTPDQQAIILDGILIHNPYRGRFLDYGGFSLINPDLIQSVEIQPSGMPALTGNRIGAQIKMNTKDGSKDWSGKSSINLLSARQFFSGALSKHIKVIFSYRQSYYDWIMNRVSDKSTVYPHFSDLFIKLVWSLPGNHFLKFGILNGAEGSRLNHSGDVSSEIYSRAKNSMIYSTITGYLSDLFSYQLKLSYQSNDDTLSTGLNEDNKLGSSMNIKNAVQHAILQGQWDWSEYRSLKIGYEQNFIYENRNTNSEFLETPGYQGKNHNSYYLHSLYGKYVYRLDSSLFLGAGLRFIYPSFNKQATYNSGVSLKYQYSPEISISGHWGKHNQYYLLADENTNTYPRIAKHQNHPTTSEIYSLGLKFQNQNHFRISFEFYHRHTERVPVKLVSGITPKYTKITFDNIGKIKSVGIEIGLFYVAKKHDLNYAITLSNTMFKRVPSTEWESAYFDNRIWSVLSHKYYVNNRWILGNSVKYATGFPLPKQVGWVKTDEDGYKTIPTSQTSRYRYFRWDIRITYIAFPWQIYLELINLTNSRNISQFIHSTSAESQSTTLKTLRVHMLPRIPLFGVQYEF